ncbi:forkhead box protein M1 [Gastrophryne carolinensis]
MRSSPRRPLILKRRKLNLSQKDGDRSAGTLEQRPPPVTNVIEQHRPSSSEPSPVVKTWVTTGCPVAPGSRMMGYPQEQDAFPDSVLYTDDSSLGISTSCTPPSTGITAEAVKVEGQPTIPATQLVVIPPNSDVQSIIQALTVRGREGGGPNKFILVSESPSFHTEAEKLGFQCKEEEVMTVQIAAEDSGRHKEEDDDYLVNLGNDDLNISLTNMQWLDKMATDDLATCDGISEPAEKENVTLAADYIKVKEEPTEPPQHWHISISERPPYSYMALIQFAINSTPNKRMMLKDIYTWIEDHFPYFKYVAKPGWKNSIRHNLSLHDMFVRESFSNNKISYWTIHPQANRCLTLDQVYKVSSPRSPERKMKPLLPRIDSYLVPVQFPVTQPVFFSPVEAFCPEAAPPEPPHSSKRVKIAPKVVLKVEDSPPTPPALEQMISSAPLQCRRDSGSRRKQQLPNRRCQEPELILPECSLADSGLDTDFSCLQDTQAQEGPSQLTQDEDCTFKTPIKERLKPPASSTPSKPPDSSALPPWNFDSPLTRSLLPDLSPVRIPCGTALTPFKDSYGALSFGETPFKELPFFGSPAEPLGLCSPGSPLGDALETPKGARKRCSKELQVGGAVANRSLLEGLVLDIKDESLSKILLDISFSGLEEDNGPGGDNSYLGQLLSELR